MENPKVHPNNPETKTSSVQGPVPGKVISLKKVQTITGLHPMYIRRLCRDGKITAQKRGSMWVIDAESFVRWNEARKQRKALGVDDDSFQYPSR